MEPSLSVTSVDLHQGDDLRSCSTCGEVEYVAWTVQVNDHLPEVRCTTHASFDVISVELGQQFAASLLTAKVSDDTLADDLVEGVRTMLDVRARRSDLAKHLTDLWEAVPYGQTTAPTRLLKARFLLGSAAFALLPSVPVANDEDLCEQPVSGRSVAEMFPVARRG